MDYKDNDGPEDLIDVMEQARLRLLKGGKAKPESGDRGEGAPLNKTDTKRRAQPDN